MASRGKSQTPILIVETSRRVFPTTPLENAVTTALSILDATVARFTPCSGVWFFDAEPTADARDPEFLRHLELSFRQTLSRYPQWAGQLRWASEHDSQTFPRSCGRPVVTYGGGEGVGVDYMMAKCSADLISMVPSREARSTTDKIWMASDILQELQAPTKLAFSNLAEYEELPGAAIQVTAFNCGSYSVNVKISHCLSDAHTLVSFVHAWAAEFRGQGKHHYLPKPIFDPSILDRYAGTITAKQSEPQMMLTARSLPMHRFDWWSFDAPGYPGWAVASSAATMPPPEVLARHPLSPSTAPPWSSWDMSLPVEHAQIYFSAAEVARMKDAAIASLPSTLSTQRVSRLDSLLSHVWMLVNRSRGHQSNEESVYLDVTLGLRSRLSPPLPESFVGSPLLLMYVADSGKDASAGPIGRTAGRIRQSLTQFTPESISAHLNDAAHEVSPQRLWQAFLGSKHTLVTSWADLKAYEVRFDRADTPQPTRHVQGVMPRVDGLVQIMDIGSSGDFDVGLCLEKEAMGRLSADPRLRAYE